MMTTPRFSRIARRAQRGVAMIEAMIAILLLAVGLIGTMALQVKSQAALSEAEMRAEATIAANELIGVMATDLDHLSDYAVVKNATPGTRLEAWHEALAARLPNPAFSVAVAPVADTERTAVTIVIQWRRSDQAQSQQNEHRIVTYLARSA